MLETIAPANKKYINADKTVSTEKLKK